jgi:transcriptional regulator GlxA family with amidase domain
MAPVCGVETRLVRDPALSTWMRNVSPAIRRLGAVRAGSFLLAEAGLLNGKRATTHWKFNRELAKRYFNGGNLSPRRFIPTSARQYFAVSRKCERPDFDIR